METVNVLIGCEHSGVVREAFRARGHNAWSCDLLPAADNSPYHLQGDMKYAIVADNGFFFPQLGGHVAWDLGIFHPPCTFLANSGVKHLYIGGRKENGRDEQRWRDLDDAVKFFGLCHTAAIPRVAVENPVHHLHARTRIGFAPTQYIQPWQFGHREMKMTGLWLRKLPALRPTNVVGPPPSNPNERKSWQRVHREPPGPDRWKRRSITYQGIADAMAEQWGAL